MATEIRVDVVIVDKDLLAVDMTDKKQRSEFISAMQGLQKSDAWKYLKAYFTGMMVGADTALDSVGSPNEALLIAAKRSLLKRILTYPETMLEVAGLHVKQELINEKRTQEQPKHPQAPRFGGKKEEK